MKKRVLLALIVLGIVVFSNGCGGANPRVVEKTPVSVYKATINVVDSNSKPLNNVKLDYIIKDSISNAKMEKTIIFSKNYTIKPKINSYNRKWVIGDKQYSTWVCDAEIKFSVSKKGYYPKQSNFLYHTGEYPCSYDEDHITIILNQPSDYLNQIFYKSLNNEKLKNSILKYVNSIVIEGYLADSVLEYGSINKISFKHKNYLQMKFKNATVYNSLKLNKYDIGKKLFDKLVRKILNPLNVLDSNHLLYGYDIIVIGYTKNFINDDDSDHSIEYHFMIPADIVKKYKNKDITGQQLLDSSIILIDNERVSLKLQ
ncbi:hypothetical protein MLC35_03525 [Sulfurimonas sp. NW7]|uniref:hypothetical protein n=1 Tax=Sulfurimonas sp. NW7 TaxID=2922727 RepID=UPI003DA88CD0